MFPAMDTAPVDRITVPLGTVSVIPLFTVKLLNWSVPPGGLVPQFVFAEIVTAPSRPSPKIPTGPAAPVAPAGPVAPAAPVAPFAPVAPVGPGTVDAAPVAPVAPVGPVGPVGPTAPAIAIPRKILALFGSAPPVP